MECDVHKLLEALLPDDVPKRLLGTVMAAVLQVCPDVPVDVLRKISVSMSAKDGSNFQTNAAMVVAAWDKSRGV